MTYPDEILTTVDGVLKTANDEERAYIYAHFDDGEDVIPYVLYCRTGDGDEHIFACVLILGGIVFTGKGFIEEWKARKNRTIVENSGYYNLPENVSFDHAPDQNHNP